MMKDGFSRLPSPTDLHITSMNAGIKNMLNVADKMLALGQTVPQVFEEMTAAPATRFVTTSLAPLHRACRSRRSASTRKLASWT